MAAGIKNLYIEQGASFRMQLTWKEPLLNDAGAPVLDASGVPEQGDPIDLSDATAHMQVRPRVGGDTLLDLTTEAGDIVLGGALGTLSLHITPEKTASLTSKRARYDLYLLFPNRDEAVRLLQGDITVDLAITREVDPLPVGGTDPVYGLTP